MSRTLIIIGLAIAAVDQLSYRAHAPSASTTFEKIVLKQTCTAVDFGWMFTRKITLRRHARSVQAESQHN
jgi:hypothetical protein